jgi:hypothetical protein
MPVKLMSALALGACRYGQDLGHSRAAGVEQYNGMYGS